MTRRAQWSRHAVPAKKRFGQHFLEAGWADKVISAIAPRAHDDFLEIGPGRGALTHRLTATAARVVAVEVDRDLAATLATGRPSNLHVVNRDFLDLSIRELRGIFQDAAMTGRVRVAGNLPYNVAAPILFHLRDLAAGGLSIADATVMVQREVADRLTARPGRKQYGVLTVLIGYRAAIERLLDLPPGAFRPAPKVRSTLLRLRFHEPDPRPLDEEHFEQLTKALFSRRRKTLANALTVDKTDPRIPRNILLEAGLDGQRRPETLTIAELVGLANASVAASGHSLSPT